jgi:hypothetical protein
MRSIRACLFAAVVAACAISAACQQVPVNTWVPCPPADVTLLEGARELFSNVSFIPEHLNMTTPPAFSTLPAVLAKSRANYEQLLRSRECAWYDRTPNICTLISYYFDCANRYSVPLTYVNEGGSNVPDAQCSGAFCSLNITVYRFSWARRRDFLTQPDAFNPPKSYQPHPKHETKFLYQFNGAKRYPFGRSASSQRVFEGQMLLIADGPGQDAADMQVTCDVMCDVM